jgi:putative DNA primase/helicase
MMVAMFDFNDVFTPPERYDLQEVKARLAATAESWIPLLFPQARLSRDRQTLRCADLSGRPPRKEGSCTLYLTGPRAGSGFDWSTNESAGPIDLIHHATGYSGARLFEEAAHLARMDMPAPPRPTAASKPDYSLEIVRIKNACEPIAGTVGETYLISRGLSDPVCPDLLFHPDLTDYESKRGWPGLVAIVRNADGTLTGGIHRTFLLDDGSGKAPAEKKMLGSIAGGSVRLMPMADGCLGIAEGIETAMSAHAIFGIPTWAALSAGNVKDWQWPEGVREVTIFRDAGEAGELSAAGLAARLSAAGIAHSVVAPIHGDDFNDDLKKGATAEEYQRLEQPRPSTLRTLAEFEAAARALTKPPDVIEVGRILGQLVQADLDPLTENQIIAIIKQMTGIPVAAINKQVEQLRRNVNATGDVNSRARRTGWASQLTTDSSGAPERNEGNVLIALENDPAFAGAIAYNSFKKEAQVVGALPWDNEGLDTKPIRPWGDADDVRLSAWLQKRELNVSSTLVSRCVNTVAQMHSFHPVREYLEGLKWDGCPRIETWTIDYLKAEDTILHRKFGALWMISAVARIMQPGAKVDHMLILEGAQDLKKSSALKALAGEWFTDEIADLGSKDAAQQMQGVWIVEMAELDVLLRASSSAVKAFLTRTTDRYRPAYGRYVVEEPRQCVFSGTINPGSRGYFDDDTGNRRFWIVPCNQVDLEGLKRARDQLWAEAMHMYRQGAVWWLTDPEHIKLARAHQDERFKSDAWDDLIDRWLVFEKIRVNDGYGFAGDWRTEEVERSSPIDDTSVREILTEAIGKDPGHWSQADQSRVGKYLTRRGWERYKKRVGRDYEWRYRRAATAD